MTPIAPRVLHILCTAFLVVAFLASFVGGYANANDSGEGGADIGAGALMFFGALAGVVGIGLGIAALVSGLAAARRRAA
ncbi:hypothetical protein K0028_14950 [Curtobacterium flaccumfaciens pv. flaccumfaciens]|jgi:hypothetical protein|uniref:hypothetical protein n=1 Tax=Curtobacterium flaccumfaciens TaxID=2035 RepID=UPI0021B0F35A|nr:hypothetical protein [Curtobacterium flaccumfaciens]QYI96947.1 hypothetical protein K0028_14950 [Curtobacterium flaccumfaciens pv. flaccumfaciens]UXN23279.1 hypothetical protein N8D77_07125 [Curtobacterium flaccumfaciens pv. flaccumfaciens]